MRKERKAGRWRRSSPRRSVRGALAGALSAALAVGGLLAGFAGTARADICGECQGPTRADLDKLPNFALERRGMFPDYYETDAGECRVDLDDIGTPYKTASWLVIRGMGEVWNCPSSTSCDTVTVSVGQDDVQSWTLTGSVSVSGKVLGIGLSATITEAVTRAVHLHTTTSLSKYLCASTCHRVFYQAWFEVAEYKVGVAFSVHRRYAWWTKNPTTGSRVWRKGNIWMGCGSGSAELAARAPIAGFWHLYQRGCDEPACGTQPVLDLGWFPKPPKVQPGPGVPDSELPGEYRGARPIGPPDTTDPGGAGPDQGAPGDDPSPPESGGDEGGAGAPAPLPPDLGEPPTGPLPDPFAEDEGAAR